jgi:hypothetical protein
VKTIVKWIRAFGHFWWDFLVGDTPEVAVATASLVALAFVLGHQHAATVAAYVLPLLVTAFLVASAWRGRNRGETGEEGH